MIVEYGSHACRFREKPPDAIVEVLRKLTTYEPEDAIRQARIHRHKTKGRGYQLESKKYLYHKGTRTFPTGLLQRVLEAVPGIEVVGMPPLVSPVDVELPFPLRPGQALAVEALLATARGAAVLVPGYGKSVVCGVLAKRLPTSRVLVTVPAKRLLHQNRAEMAMVLGEPVGILGDQESELDHRVVVATIQTLCRRVEDGDIEVLAMLEKVTVWISDEAHGAAADSYRPPSKAMVNAHTRWGLTATYEREDGCGPVMEAVLGPKVFEYTYEEAFADGSLTPPVVVLKPVPVPPGPHGNVFNFNKFYQQHVTHHVMRNLRVLLDVTDFVDHGLTPCLVMVRIKEHGRYLAELLDAPFVNGDAPSKKTDKVLEDFLAGSFPVLVASSVLNVGVNTKALVSAVNAAGGDSRVATEQKAGRGLRLYPGKTRFYLVDYEEAEPRVFWKHARTRKLVYKKCFPGRVKSGTFESVRKYMDGNQ